jgi:chloramphenicol 3-O phosphotransferase
VYYIGLYCFGIKIGYKMTEKNKYQIIYFNGPSSVGKSTLARAIQNKLKSPFLVIGIDQLIYMMPEKMNDWHNETKAPGFSWHPVKDEQGKAIAYKIHTGPFGKRMVQAFRDVVLTLVQSGHNIIIDDVSFGKEQVDAWRDALKNFNVLWVGVTAPIEILEQREKERGDRKLRSARWLVEHVHKGVDYDLMVDTHEKKIDENVGVIVQCLGNLRKRILS